MRALMVHPDKNTAPKSKEAFQKVGQAFDRLKDPKSRQSYDIYFKVKTHIQCNQP